MCNLPQLHVPSYKPIVAAFVEIVYCQMVGPCLLFDVMHVHAVSMLLKSHPRRPPCCVIHLLTTPGHRNMPSTGGDSRVIYPGSLPVSYDTPYGGDDSSAGAFAQRTKTVPHAGGGLDGAGFSSGSGSGVPGSVNDRVVAGGAAAGGSSASGGGLYPSESH